MTLNPILVPAVNVTNLKSTMSAQEIQDLEVAVAADGSTLVSYLDSLYNDAVVQLSAKRLELRTATTKQQRASISLEIRKQVFRKVGALAYRNAMS